MFFNIERCPISWKATLQVIVALSTKEVEYMAVIEVVKEAIWLIGLFGDLISKQDETIVFCNS